MIFINYRRSLSSSAAGRLAENLQRHFSPREIFLDVNGIEPGIDFVKRITERIEKCRVFIVVIGPGWAGARSAVGDRSITDPADYVRVEIEAALRRDILVVPVLIDGATMPRSDDLPITIKKLAYRNAVELSHSHFARDVDQLTQNLQMVLRGDLPTESATDRNSWIWLLFSLTGRISIKWYWLGLLIFILTGIFFYILALFILKDYALRDGEQLIIKHQFNTAFIFLLTPIEWSIFSIFIKRIHDFNQGRNLAMIWVVLQIGSVLAMVYDDTYSRYATGLASLSIAFIVDVIRGTRGTNNYGQDPRLS